MKLLTFSNREEALSAVEWSTLCLYGIFALFTIAFVSSLKDMSRVFMIFIFHYIFMSIALIFLIRLNKSRTMAFLLLPVQLLFGSWQIFSLLFGNLWGIILCILFLSVTVYVINAAIVFHKLNPEPFSFKDKFLLKITGREQAEAVLEISLRVMLVILSVNLYFTFWTFILAGIRLYYLVNYVPLFALVFFIHRIRSRIAAFLLAFTILGWIMNIAVDSEKITFMNDYSLVKHWHLTLFFILAVLVSIRMIQATIAFHRNRN